MQVSRNEKLFLEMEVEFDMKYAFCTYFGSEAFLLISSFFFVALICYLFE